MGGEFIPRDYQEKQVKGFWKGTKEHPGKNLLLCLATGGGKTIVIADILRGIIKVGYRAIVLARSKELVIQNHDKFSRHLPGASSGIYCAGLGKKESDEDIVFGTIQSICNKAEELGDRQLIVVDEAHQIPMREESQYQKLLNSVKCRCPNAILLGLTASPYRLDGGVIHGPGRQFDHVADSVPLRKLIDDGYLTKPVTLNCETVDLSSIRKTAGDFSRSDVETEFLSLGDSVTDQVVSASLEKNTRSVLIFASGVNHAQKIKKRIESKGHSVGLVTGETLPLIREAILSDFDNGRIRFLVNVDVLCIGYDCSRVDHIACCRATESPGLFYQICGRGFRLHEGKKQCWIQDFGGNIERHGPIDSPTYGINTIKCKGDGQQPPSRVCPSCFAILSLSSRACSKCGLEFPRKLNLEPKATKKEILGIPKWYDVESESYRKWPGKNGKPDTLRVDYRVSIDGDWLEKKVVSEWICLQHTGYARQKAVHWWLARTDHPCTSDIDEALKIANGSSFGKSEKLLITRDGAYDRIVMSHARQQKQKDI